MAAAFCARLLMRLSSPPSFDHTKSTRREGQRSIDRVANQVPNNGSDELAMTGERALPIHRASPDRGAARIEWLDGVRACAATYVMLHHTPNISQLSTECSMMRSSQLARSRRPDKSVDRFCSSSGLKTARDDGSLGLTRDVRLGCRMSDLRRPEPEKTRRWRSLIPRGETGSRGDGFARGDA